MKIKNTANRKNKWNVSKKSAKECYKSNYLHWPRTFTLVFHKALFDGAGWGEGDPELEDDESLFRRLEDLRRGGTSSSSSPSSLLHEKGQKCWKKYI